MIVNNGIIKSRALPEGWRWVKLGEVCEFRHGGTPSKSNPSFWNGDIPWVSPKDMKVSRLIDAEDHISKEAVARSNVGIASANSILIVVRSGILSHYLPVALVGCELAFNQDIKAIVQKMDLIDPLFLIHYLRGEEVTILADGIKKGATVHSFKSGYIENFRIPLPPLAEQKRIAAILNEQIAAVERTREAAQAQLDAAKALQFAFIKSSLCSEKTVRLRLSDCLTEVNQGIGSAWNQFPVLGATREGLAPAKEPVGKTPERYKKVDEGTIFYNPMRILLGSIALVDKGDPAGITSPDYVVIKPIPGILHFRWFYYWLRSPLGEEFIRSLARGAVRERVLFNRLSKGVINMPTWRDQEIAAENIIKIKPLISKISLELIEIGALPSTILRRAFSGEI